MSKPNWDFWLQIGNVKPWQACALSLDIDPDSLREGYRNEGVHRVRTVDEWKSRVESRGYILFSKDIEEQFDKRLRLLIANIQEFVTPESRISRDPKEQPVPLSEFAAWALSRRTPWGIPPELAALATKVAPQIDKASESRLEPGKEDGAEKPWQEVARQIADELDRGDMAVSCHDSVRHLGERVADRLREKKVFGPRGPLSAGNVLREALQGDKWNNHRPNRGKSGKSGNPDPGKK